jgi:hypothetical protein
MGMVCMYVFDLGYGSVESCSEQDNKMLEKS